MKDLQKSEIQEPEEQQLARSAVAEDPPEIKEEKEEARPSSTQFLIDIFDGIGVS